MTREEMSKIVDRILELDPKYKKFTLTNPDRRRIQAAPGASFTALDKLSRSFPRSRLPDSYRMLLELHDGIENFKYVDSAIHSADTLRELLARGNDGRGDPGETEENRIFFISGEDWEAVGFDTTTVRSDGEMQVVEYDKTGEVDRWTSLPDFLVAYLAWLEDAYGKALTDRKGLEE